MVELVAHSALEVCGFSVEQSENLKDARLTSNSGPRTCGRTADLNSGGATPPYARYVG